MVKQQASDLTTQMLGQFGPTLSGKNLYSALGFKTYASFYRSLKRCEIGVPVFTLPGRRGWFALTGDVASWLDERRAENGQKVLSQP
jgi:hypothetical protein